MQIFNGDTCLVQNVRVADRFWSRFMGLMGKKELPPSSGLLLKRCGSIHTCFMRFTIDVIYLDKNNVVLKGETVRPWRVGSVVHGAKDVLELPEGMKDLFPEGIEIRLQ